MSDCVWIDKTIPYPVICAEGKLGDKGEKRQEPCTSDCQLSVVQNEQQHNKPESLGENIPRVEVRSSAAGLNAQSVAHCCGVGDVHRLSVIVHPTFHLHASGLQVVKRSEAVGSCGR
jgi:hypothetical protein